MKINVERSYVEEDLEVDVVVAKTDEGFVEHIDFVDYCEDCEDMRIVQRFVPIPDDLLQDIIESDEESCCHCGGAADIINLLKSIVEPDCQAKTKHGKH